MAGRLQYFGTFWRPASSVGYQVTAYASGVESYNYFGPGNDTPRETNRSVYKTRENVFFFSPTVQYQAGPRFEIHGGPEVRYSSTPTDTGTIVATEAPLGVGRFGLVAVRGGLSFDSRQSATFKVRADLTDTESAFGKASPVSGVRFQASGVLVPKAWDVASQYGAVDGLAAAYLGTSRAHLALRAGGRKLWGPYPWFDAAYIGGSTNRGFSSHRFAGDSSLYASAALRTWLGTIPNRAVPLRVGVNVFTDTGRVWLAGQPSNTWHTSIGAAAMLQPVAVPFLLDAMLAHSREGYRFYFGFGYPF